MKGFSLVTKALFITMSEILNDLNASQRDAVEYCDGAQLVIAGAGSGKTRVLTYKIAYLLENGMKPWAILALTFTNKAAREMKDRIGKLVGTDVARELNMGTFHSIFARILRVESGHVGYQSNYTIYDQTDSRTLVKNIIKSMGLDDKKYKPSTVQGIISRAKNGLYTAEEYEEDAGFAERDKEAGLEALPSVYKAYQSHLRQANAMDFDDLLLNTYILFRDNDDIRQKYSHRYSYILVDEYQDTNSAQQEIVSLLAGGNNRVCVVGDDYQSIYSFRGANIDNILDFQEKFPGARLFKLERNYRSTQNIVKAANSLMKHNKRQIRKDVYSDEAAGDKIEYRPAYSDKEEAAIVANEIRKIRKDENGLYSDFAILYRTNAQSRPFEEEFRKDGIPYKIYGGLSFYQRKEIKDVIAYFRMVSNPDDEEAFLRIVNYPARGIGNTTIQKVNAAAEGRGVSPWKVISHPGLYGLNVNKGTMAKLGAFRDLIGSFIVQAANTDVYTLGQEIIRQSGIAADIYSSKDPEYLSKQENLEELLSSMQSFVVANQEEGRDDEVYLRDYLADVALLTDQDNDDADNNTVTMMTIHAAKGLEFPTVFVVGLEEQIFPSPMAAQSKRGIEEERRLLYVAITRAERHCILTNARNRFRFGSMQVDVPSRFLADIDKSLIKSYEDDEPSDDYYDTREPAFGSSRRGGYGNRMPWDRKPRPWESGPRLDDRYQNSVPAAGQFMADPKLKVTHPRKPEKPVDPFSARAREVLSSEGTRFRRVAKPVVRPVDATGPSSGGHVTARNTPSSIQTAAGVLSVGCVIEHQRFGIGKVTLLEGTGENAKATVEFRNTGRKQLLLKFAKFKIVG